MWRTFSRSQLAALAATIVDFGTLTLWVEVGHQFYAYGVALGACMGAITNFLINRYWSFEAHHAPIHGQAFRYALVSAGSLVLNTFGVYLITERFGLHYMISKVTIAFLIGIFYNYPLHRYFVYEPNPQSEPA
ncbi:MAG: GtrA family protein [Bdellovibrionales bacterium]|nr:GtrA family protein [Bdellovibrionales bacterium]